MVDSLEGSATQTKVLGLLARSVLRAASRLTVRVSGAHLLAARNAGGDAEKPPTVVHEPSAFGHGEAANGARRRRDASVAV